MRKWDVVKKPSLPANVMLFHNFHYFLFYSDILEYDKKADCESA